jgi:hypothetical protein
MIFIANENLLNEIEEDQFYTDIDRPKDKTYKIMKVKHNAEGWYDVYVKVCVKEYIEFDIIPADDTSKKLVKRTLYQWVPKGNNRKFHKRFFNETELFDGSCFEYENY